MATNITVTTNNESTDYTVATGGRGPAGEPGSDANVTNANVRSAGALMDDEVTNLAQVKSFDSSDYDPAGSAAAAQAAAAVDAAVKDATYPIITNPEAIHHFYDQFVTFQMTEYPGDGKYIVVGTGGDSMSTGSSGFILAIASEMFRRFGQGCVASSSFSGGIAFGTGQLSMTTTLGGAAVLLSNDFTYLPNGEYWSVPAAGTITETPNSANIHAGFTKIRCWYGIRAGGGTLTFTVTQNGIPLTAKNVATSIGTAGTIGYVDFDAADGLVLNGKPSLVVSNATATSHYLGSYMYLGSGVIPVSVGRGGSSYAQALSSTAVNLATLCAAMDMRLCFHAVKEEDLTLVNLGLMMDRWAVQHPRCSHIWVGNTSSPSNEVADTASNAEMRAKAQSLSMTFVDGQKLLRTVAYLGTVGSLANGWNESVSAPHLTSNARSFIAQWVIDKVLMGLHVPGGRFNLHTSEAAAMRMLSNTTRTATIWAQPSYVVGASNFTHTTPDMGRFTYNYTASPAPVANTARAGKFMTVTNGLNRRMIMRYGLFDGSLVNGMEAVLIVGGGGVNEINGMTGSTFFGVRIIHGTTLISGHQIPYIRFAVKGATTVETISPKIYHSSATGVAPWAGGTWRVNGTHIYWVEMIGSGASTTKRFRAWHQPVTMGGSETRIAQRRLIADWSGTITAGGSMSESVCFGLVSDGSPATPPSSGNCSLEFFEMDIGPRFVTDASQQDFNY